MTVSLKEKPMPEFRITMPYMDLISIDKLFGPRFLNQMVEPGGQVYNLSIRQAMIYVSEIIIKPRLGFDYFGRARMGLLRITWHTCILTALFSSTTIAQHHSMEDQMN